MSYFNSLPFREALKQLGVCRFMDKSEFTDGVGILRGKKIVIVGAGAQGLNQGLNLRDSGLDVPREIAENGLRSRADGGSAEANWDRFHAIDTRSGVWGPGPAELQASCSPEGHISAATGEKPPTRDAVVMPLFRLC